VEAREGSDMAENKLTVQGTVVYALLMGVGLVVIIFCLDVVTGSHSETLNSFHLKPAINVFFLGFIAGTIGKIISAIIMEK
jgi:hypothetical protein